MVYIWIANCTDALHSRKKSIIQNTLESPTLEEHPTAQGDGSAIAGDLRDLRKS